MELPTVQGITLPPTLVTPESGPPTAYLSGGTTHYDIPHPRQLFAGSLTIKVPEDFDNIRDLRSLGLELPLIVFSLNTKPPGRNGDCAVCEYCRRRRSQTHR